MNAETRKEWRPMRCAHGLTIWTHGPPKQRFAIIRRDSDGLRVTSAHVFHPVKPERMRMLYQEFDNAVGATIGGFINAYDKKTATPEHKTTLLAYIAELDALMARHVTTKPLDKMRKQV